MNGKQASKKHPLKGLKPLVEQDQLPEGLYRARVTAWEGSTNITRQPQANEPPTNVSDYFWIRLTGVDEEPASPVNTREITVPTYMDARRMVQ